MGNQERGHRTAQTNRKEVKRKSGKQSSATTLDPEKAKATTTR
jgi:hypothetical protein